MMVNKVRIARMTIFTILFGLIMALSQAGSNITIGQLIATAISAGSCGFISTPTAVWLNCVRKKNKLLTSYEDEEIANLVFYFYSIVVLWALFGINYLFTRSI